MSRRRTVFVRDFYYKAADDIFVRKAEEPPLKPYKALSTYSFRRPELFPDPGTFNKDDLPLVFRASPDTLLTLCINVVEKWPLPDVYKWDIEDVCRWLRRYGYPQYQNTFRVNLITGRKMLLLDASALSAMNIKNFSDICHIAYGIRCLFYFQMTKFSRSISLAPEYHLELYKLFRVKQGQRYDTTLVSDLWRRMQLIRPISGFKEHWEILERWLKLEQPVKELIGGTKRHELYKCRKAATASHVLKLKPKCCECMPPCECFWTERETRDPWKLSLLGSNYEKKILEDNHVLSVLKETYPQRYKCNTLRGFNILQNLHFNDRLL